MKINSRNFIFGLDALGAIVSLTGGFDEAKAPCIIIFNLARPGRFHVLFKKYFRWRVDKSFYPHYKSFHQLELENQMARKTDNQVRKQFARWTDQDLANRWNVSKLDARNVTQTGQLKVSYIKLTDEILREAEFRGIKNMLCCDTSSFKTLAEALAFKPYD